MVDAIAHYRPRQPVVFLAGFDQAVLIVDVAPRPTASIGKVTQNLEVADGVVLVVLGVVAQHLQVIGIRPIPDEWVSR